MSYRSRFAVATVLLATLLVAASPLYAEPGGGVGLYPSTVEWPGLVRGNEYFKDVGVLNSGDDPRLVTVLTSGELGSWLTVHQPEDRVAPLTQFEVAANSEARLLMRVKVPPEAANREYKGGITFSTKLVSTGDSQPGASTGVSLGLGMDVLVVVSGTQRLEGTVRDIGLDDTETGLPLRIAARFVNTGNVSAKPQIDLVVQNATGETVMRSSTGNVQVPPGENEVVNAEWDTAGQPAGDYTATIAVTLDGLQLRTEKRPFKILPRGTLTRRGELIALTLVTKAEAGAVAKANAVFMNTGEIDTRVVFLGELYRDGVLIQAITSPEKLVLQRQEGAVEVFLNIAQDGVYQLKGKANFEGKESEVMELEFRVGLDLPVGSLLMMGGVATVALAFGGVGFRIVRRRRTRV